MTAPLYPTLSLPSVLFLIFLVLKLCEVITWSWWLVTMPLWIIPALVVVIILVITAFMLVFTNVSGRKKY